MVWESMGGRGSGIVMVCRSTDGTTVWCGRVWEVEGAG